MLLKIRDIEMAENARLRFFDIEKCGFYDRNDPSTSLFSGVPDTLQRLGVWASEQNTLEETVTFESDPDREIRRSFYVGIDHNRDSGDILLALWNEVPNDEGVVFGMSGSQQPGDTTMLETGFVDPNAIPGMISYFWFIPEFDKFASVKFSHSDHGKTQLDNYIQSYLVNFSDYRVTRPSNPHAAYGYSATAQATDGCEDIHPKFFARTTKNDSVRQQLVGNVSRIRSIIKEQEYSYSVPDDRDMLERFFDNLLNNPPLEVNGSKEVISKLNYRPSIAQIDEMISNYELRDANLKRVGFKLSGESTPIYLDGINVIIDFEFEIERQRGNAIPVATLANAIYANRPSLLRSMRSET